MQLFVAWKMGVGRKRGGLMWKLSFRAIIWAIWKERNRRCFEQESILKPTLLDKVKFLDAPWAAALLQFHVISIDSI